MTDAYTTPVMLITGGTGSIGTAVALRALREGWRVVIQGRTPQSLQTALAALREQCSACDPAGVVANIHHADAVEPLVASAVAQYGRLDAVVDCLVTGPTEGRLTGAFESTTPEYYGEFLQLSLAYLERLAHAALPHLVRQRGCLITFVSDAGVFPAPQQTLIGAARAGAIGFIKNLAAEVARDGVRAHCISPSYVLETRTAQRLQTLSASRLQKAQARAGLGLPTPADIAPMVLFLCGPDARCITGQVISINGGLNV